MTFNHTSAPLVITSGTPLPLGKVGSAYNITLSASGGIAPYTWSLAGGSLPAGLTLSRGGVISGTTTVSGASTITVQAVDAALKPQTVTITLVLPISAGTLKITTSSLPTGMQGAAYSAQLAASGGVAPYRWSVNAGVPAGLTLSGTGALSGTPAGASGSSPEFLVQDADNETASVKLGLLINPAPAPIPDNRYSFYFSGTAPQGTPVAANAVVINGTFVIQNGKVLSGFYDENNNTGADPAVEQPISGGGLTGGTDGLGQLVLKGANGVTMTFALATPASAGVGKDSDVRMIEFDDSTGAGTRGSGILKPASLNPTAAAIQGNFAFQLGGSEPDGKGQVLMGSFRTDGSGNITGGLADSNQGGTVEAYPQVLGNYAVDANGRGTFGIVLGAGTIEQNTVFHFSFYQASPGEWMVISVDPMTIYSPLVGGLVLQQTGGPFGAASLPKGTSVLELSGLAPAAGGTVPDVTLGLGISDGSGKLSFNLDEYNGTLRTGQSLAVTYTVDATTGRIATRSSSGTGPMLYVIDSTRAFTFGSDTATSFGMLESQTGSSFTSASFSGDYLGGSVPVTNPSVLNESGLLTADGDGNLLMTTNRSTEQGLVQYQNVSGSYSVDSNGRVVVTTPDGLARIFYVISPTRVAYLTEDGGGYLGIFEQ